MRTCVSDHLVFLVHWCLVQYVCLSDSLPGNIMTLIVFCGLLGCSFYAEARVQGRGDGTKRCP